MHLNNIESILQIRTPISRRPINMRLYIQGYIYSYVDINNH